MSARLFASDGGDGRHAVVLLHGFGGWHGVWTKLAAGIASRVIAYDLPGHARSTHVPGAGSAKRVAEAILADLSERDVDSVDVVGHSMGGAVAVLLGMSRPALVRSLTLLAPGGFGEVINAPLLQRFAAAVTADELAHCLAEMSGPGMRIEEEAAAELARVRNLPGQADALCAIAAAITRGGRQGVIPRPALAALPMPVTVIWGTVDPVLPYAQAGDLPAHFTLVPAEGAGHMLIEEAPLLILETVRGIAGTGNRVQFR